MVTECGVIMGTLVGEFDHYRYVTSDVLQHACNTSADSSRRETGCVRTPGRQVTMHSEQVYEQNTMVNLFEIYTKVRRVKLKRVSKNLLVNKITKINPSTAKEREKRATCALATCQSTAKQTIPSAYTI